MCVCVCVCALSPSLVYFYSLDLGRVFPNQQEALKESTRIFDRGTQGDGSIVRRWVFRVFRLGRF